MKKRYRPRGSAGKRDRRGWLDPRRHHRKAGQDHTCRCAAHEFPHRLFTRRCKPALWVAEFYERRNPACSDCNNRDGPDCQVVQDLEPAFHCPALREFIQYEGIKLYGRAREQWEKVVGDGRLRKR